MSDVVHQNFGIVNQNSTAAYESAPLGTELLTADGWTSVGWTGDFASGWDHTTGNTTALLNSLAAVTNNFYQITYTVTGRTAGTFRITFGGVTSNAISATGAWGPKATSTGTLSITPTTDFDGAIVISIKEITGTYNAVLMIKNAAGFAGLEIRSTTHGLWNIALGPDVLKKNTSGFYNVGIGYLALPVNTTGYQNFGLGYKALYNNTTGHDNIAIGPEALLSNISGYYNIAIGYHCQHSNTTGQQNTAIGYVALYNNQTGVQNTAIGIQSLYNVTGSYNTGIGVQALFNITSGTFNVGIGVGAGRFTAASASNQTSTNSVYIGYVTKPSADGNTNEIVIGSTAVGNGSNTATLGNTSVTGWYMGATKLIGVQGAAVADATGAGDVVAQLNTLLARLRTHGLIAS